VTRNCYQLTVTSVIRETADACSLVLSVPAELASVFDYRPGQFITVRVPSTQTGSVARCYSMSSMPGASSLTITVKRTADGYASGYLHDRVLAGSVLDVLPPAGTFTPSGPSGLDGGFLMFAAGSGITPVMSILTSVLRTGRGRVVLVYANRDERSVIFGAALRSLMAEYPGRLTLLHWLDSLHGMPSAASICSLVRPYAADYEPYICGPDAFLQVVRSALSSLEVPARKVRVERFLSLAENPFESVSVPSDGGVDATLTVSLDGDTRVLPWPAGARMLDVLIAAGLDAPFSCRQGVCGACACQLTGGKVDMAHNQVLEDADLADDYILACQSVALTPEVSIDY
jgi:3-ketosteroid 9alpha-monooxygenase subunit B